MNKVFIFISILFAYTSLLNAQNKTILYDSLYNIGYIKETDKSIKKYIGQEIKFLERFKANVPQYYANFDYEKSVVVDTTWIKIRKNKKKIKPTDYELIRTTSYNPTFVKKGEVVLAGASSYHYEKKADRHLFSYYPKGGYIETPKRSGYFTHYKDIEGKEFKILDVKTEPVGSIFLSFIFKLQSKDGQILKWTAECNTMDYKKIAYPIVVKGYLEKIKNKYLNKDFYFFSPEYTGEKYTCKNITFRPHIGGYYSPYIELKSSNETIFIPLINTPNLFDTEIKDDDYLIEERHLVLSSIYEKEREEYNQKKLTIEKQKNEEKKLREKSIIKKYGSYYGKLILQEKVALGMSKDMVRESWGTPSDINRTIGNFGVHEQWVYESGNYLYFENGKLTTIQD